MVDEVLKDNGDVEINDHVSYRIFGTLPVGSSEESDDAASKFPILWPLDTEFILFMDREEGKAHYYIPWSECGRVLTDGESVTCSDGDRSALGFMDGLSREDFIEAVVEEVEYGLQRVPLVRGRCPADGADVSLPPAAKVHRQCVSGNRSSGQMAQPPP